MKAALAKEGIVRRAPTARTARAFVRLALVLLVLTAALVAVAAPGAGELESVIVRGDATARSAVEQVGGEVTRDLPLIGGFSAEVPPSAVPRLRSASGIESVTPNTRLEPLGWDDEFARDASAAMASGADNPISSMAHVTAQTGAREYWDAGYTGAGVDVAIIDTGVAEVEGLNESGKVVNGLDVSFDSQVAGAMHIDRYGHGTHLAGIIAGRDAGPTPTSDTTGRFLGMAPDARIVNVKVGDLNGVVDVSQVIAAIDWVVQHRNDGDLNIRVLNLSYGTTSSQAYTLDPLAFAVDQAWANGIVVVVAAGNDGQHAAMRNPSHDPYVLAVGAVATNATKRQKDDVIAEFSVCGTANRHVDIVAPGQTIKSLRAPGSTVDQAYPSARVGNRRFLGSGTSQAAAVVSGAAALVIEQHPTITPDKLKKILERNADPLSGVSEICQGDGSIDLGATLGDTIPGNWSIQDHTTARGTGSLEAARGDSHVIHDRTVLEGEIDIMGNPWNGAKWADLAEALQSWDGGKWNGSVWSGASWSGASWSGASWSGASWSGASWSGASWSNFKWSSASWSSGGWNESAWLGLSWEIANVL